MAKDFLPESRYGKSTLDLSKPQENIGKIVHVQPKTYVSEKGLNVIGKNFNGFILNDLLTIYENDTQKFINSIKHSRACITAKVIGYHEKSKVFILSRKDSMEDAVKEIYIGKILTAKIKGIYGTTYYLDIGAGITAILPVRELSITFIPEEDVLERFNKNRNIKVMVTGESNLYKYKYVSSYKKAFEPLPIEPGDVIYGKVTSILPDCTGAVVEISPVQAGIVDLNSESFNLVKPGNTYEFYVLRVRPKDNGILHYSLILLND